MVTNAARPNGVFLVTHFGVRYEEAAPLVQEARQIFPNTEAAEDLLSYDV